MRRGAAYRRTLFDRLGAEAGIYQRILMWAITITLFVAGGGVLLAVYQGTGRPGVLTAVVAGLSAGSLVCLMCWAVFRVREAYLARYSCRAVRVARTSLDSPRRRR